MSNKKNNAASKKEQAKTNTFLCVDLKYQAEEKMIQPTETREGSITYCDQDHFLFAEKVHNPQPALHWRLINRTKHGKVSVNSRHVKVEFYIRHGEYVSEKQLADILSSESEVIGDALCETDLAEEVDKCC